MLLLIFAGLGVLVLEDEVDLIGSATLIRTEHNDIGRGVGKLLGVELLVILEELHVGSTALKTIWSHGQLVLLQN